MTETPARASQCPKCGLPLRPLKSAGVTLDACVECEGLWFDRGQVERIIGAEAAGPFRGQIAGPGSRVTKAGCPRGHGAMREVTVDLDGQKTDVSGCTRCGGAWISRGDLIQIRRYARRRDLAAGGRIGGLELQVAEAQLEADDRLADEKQETAEAPKRAWVLQLAGGVPLEVYNPVRHRPFATYTLIALNVLVFAAQIASDPRMRSDPASSVGLIDRFALVPSA
ncbi:MAG TPA: zf-TFIIB domain-containing protein, partial [Anaeromyxobacteraceae bacterium]|nr:zf-TFIIB domain-containing protein [Anaeromyxobacteraceae bacterium]